MLTASIVGTNARTARTAMVGAVKTNGRWVRILIVNGGQAGGSAPPRGGRALRSVTLLAIGDEGVCVSVEFVKRSLDVGAGAGDQLFKLDAPMVAEIRPLGILPEVDRRHLGRLRQRLAEIGAELLIELVARDDAGAVQFAELVSVEPALLILLRSGPGNEETGAFLRLLVLVALGADSEAVAVAAASQRRRRRRVADLADHLRHFRIDRFARERG